MAEESEAVRIERHADGRIAVLVLDRPEKRNAINRATAELFQEKLRSIKDDPELRALVITGAGKAFSAGGDFNEMVGKKSEDAFRMFLGPLCRDVEDFPRPVIAAVNGFALGGGTEIAISCDLRIAARSARFGQPEVGIGTIPNAGGCYRLVRLIGGGRTKEMIFTGRPVDAEEALRLGLVEEVVDDDKLLPRALEIAAGIAEQAPMAVRLAKLAINAAMRGEPLEGSFERTIMAVLIDSEERRQRIGDFLAKRGKWARS